MNLLLLEPSDFQTPTQVRIGDRRLKHIIDVHRAQKGDSLRVGAIGGKMGQGLITSLSSDTALLEVSLTEAPPQPLALKLLLALPRPKFVARVLQVAASLGVKEIFLFNSYRVDKVYWSCAQLSPNEIRAACLLGLEQARDTVLPEIHLRPLFKPFVEDELPTLIAGTEALVAHPIAERVCPRGVEHPLTLAIGPEGGFIDYEIEKLGAAGFTPVKLSSRILKVETAVATLIGRLT